MSTYDGRSAEPGGNADEGLFHPNQPAGAGFGGPNYNAAGRDPAYGYGEPEFDETDFDHPDFDGTQKISPSRIGAAEGTGFNAPAHDPSGFDAPGFEPLGFGGGATTVLPEPAGRMTFDDEDASGSPRPLLWHGGADFGLLVLRLLLGGTFIAHGLQHLFGLFHGPGIHGFAAFLTVGGYKYPTILAWVGGITELGGGALLVLGLFTPLAACGVAAMMANVVVLKWPLGFFAPGYELELLLAGASVALLFTGPGRISLDRPTPWFRRPVLNGAIFLVIGAGAAVGLLIGLRHH